MATDSVMDSVARRNLRPLVRYLRFLGCDEPTAEDIAQEALLGLMQADFEERHPDATAAWLRRKARFLFLELSLEEVRDRVAVIRLTPLRKAEGAVRAGGEGVSIFMLLVESEDKPPRISSYPSRDGRYSIEVPPGRMTFLILTPDGVLHRRSVEIPPSEETLVRNFELGD